MRATRAPIDIGPADAVRILATTIGQDMHYNFGKLSKRAKRWLRAHKQAARYINPATAEVWWDYRQTFDPYSMYRKVPEKYDQVGRAYFARAPRGKSWVWFGDLPQVVSDALWKRHRGKLAFPAGLDDLDD
jgi:hypothetical protein